MWPNWSDFCPWKNAKEWTILTPGVFWCLKASFGITETVLCIYLGPTLKGWSNKTRRVRTDVLPKLLQVLMFIFLCYYAPYIMSGSLRICPKIMRSFSYLVLTGIWLKANKSLIGIAKNYVVLYLGKFLCSWIRLLEGKNVLLDRIWYAICFFHDFG